MKIAMSQPAVFNPSDANGRAKRAQSLVRQLFVDAGWAVDSGRRSGDLQPELVARRGDAAYAVEIKAAAEGRSDRLVPLLAQAVLQALRVAGQNAAPLAVVAAPKIPRRAAEHILRFAEEYAPDVAVGIVDFEGLRIFRGPRLEQFDAEPEHRASIAVMRPRQPGNLFADLNQWMLKVLLAPELPEELLSAPRGQYPECVSARARSPSLGYERLPICATVARSRVPSRVGCASSSRPTHATFPAVAGCRKTGKGTPCALSARWRPAHATPQDAGQRPIMSRALCRGRCSEARFRGRSPTVRVRRAHSASKPVSLEERPTLRAG